MPERLVLPLTLASLDLSPHAGRGDANDYGELMSLPARRLWIASLRSQ
jgi:hypothetical protein